MVEGTAFRLLAGICDVLPLPYTSAETAFLGGSMTSVTGKLGSWCRMHAARELLESKPALLGEDCRIIALV